MLYIVSEDNTIDGNRGTLETDTSGLDAYQMYSRGLIPFVAVSSIYKTNTNLYYHRNNAKINLKPNFCTITSEARFS